MSDALTVLLNYVFYKELELFYGKGSHVILNSVRFCTNNKHYIVDCKLFLSDSSLFEESQLEGLEFLLQESWKYLGMGSQKFAVISTYDFIDYSLINPSLKN